MFFTGSRIRGPNGRCPPARPDPVLPEKQEFLQEAEVSKRVRNRFEPEEYFSSASDPGFLQQEHEYITAHMFAKAADKKHRSRRASFYRALGVPKTHWDKPEEFFFDQIVKGWEHQRAVPRRFSPEKDQYVINAIKCFGQTILTPIVLLHRRPIEEWSATDRRKYRLCIAIHEVISHWQDQAKRGGLAARRRATSQLKHIGLALSSDQRGKKANRSIDHARAKLFYYQTLYRLYHVRNALRQKHLSAERVKITGDAFEVPPDVIREFWNLDEDYQLMCRPLSVKSMARILTCRRFGITEQTLSNIIASAV